MNTLPRSPFGRFLLGLWFAACVAVLVFAFLQRQLDDTDIAVLYLLIFLTFPIGYGLAAFLGYALMQVYEWLGVMVPGGFVANLFSWLLFVAIGYFQWFLAIPWAYRKVKESLNSRLDADVP